VILMHKVAKILDGLRGHGAQVWVQDGRLRRRSRGSPSPARIAALRRYGQIFTDICNRTPRTARSRAGYPPLRYIENEPRKIYAIIERFNFATVISARGIEDVVVTHVPVTLDRSRGSKGVLFGHMDRRNPHVELIDGRKLTVLFHGPNAYLSPHVFIANVLPTWNSLNVHVRGMGRVIADRDELIQGLCGICEKTDRAPCAYRLDRDDPRIDELIGGIVGFEIEIEDLVGRFKISQELDQQNRQLAALEMARAATSSQRALLGEIFGLDLDQPSELNCWNTPS